MSEKKENSGIFKWATFFGVLLAIFFGYTITRYVHLLKNDRQKYLNVVEDNELEIVEKHGHRGNIYDRKGRLVSATLPMYKISVDMSIPYIHKGGKGEKMFESRLDSLCNQMYARFGMEKPEHMKKRLMAAYNSKDKRKSTVLLIDKTLTYEEYKDVRKMALMRQAPSVGGRIEEERHHRENLFGGMAERVVGQVFGLDSANRGSGKFGLEKYFDSELSGTKGKYVKRRVGTKFYLLYPITEAENGCDVVMTIDMDIQDICESALTETLKESKAAAACMILMEVETGEIRAMVNLTRDTAGVVRQGTNMAAAMNNQPGSTFKTVAMMAALEHGGCDTGTIVKVNGGVGKFGGRDLHDSHSYPESELPLTAVLARSSNVGMAQLMVNIYHNNKNGWAEFSDDIEKIGYDKPIDIEINGLANPIIRKYKTFKGWSVTTMPSMSFGYEVQSTPLYTLNFYNAIANNGYYVRPHLVSELRRDGDIVQEFDVEKRSKRMCSGSTLEKIQYMLEGVVSRKDGTAHRYAQSKLFKVAGKTGTARYSKIGPSKKDYNYQISFVGYFPADKPKYSAIVVLMCPQNAYTGLYCGGVFKKVAETIWAMGY